MKSFVRLALAVLAVTAFLSAVADARDRHGADVAPRASRSAATYRPGVVILKLKQNVPNLRDRVGFGIPAIDDLLDRVGAAGRRPLFPMAPYGGSMMVKSAQNAVDPGFDRIYVINFTGPYDALWVVQELKAIGAIEYAEPYWTFPLSYNANDPQIAQQYALSIIKAAEAWDVTKGDTSIVIGIVDSGVEWAHADLAANIWNNPGETGLDGTGKDRRSNRIDDDGNGKIDDWHGWDFIGGPTINQLQQGQFVPDNDPAPVPSSGQGYQGYHGTWTSGCASAVADNGKGIAGAGFRSRILAMKCSDDSYATGQVIAGYDGIIYSADMKAKVINCSFGGEVDPAYVQSLQQVIDYAYTRGSLVVAAAGNFAMNNDETPHYPASLKRVLAVGASTSQDSAASFSHYGVSVDVYAPGANILTTHLGDQYIANGVSGTSFSAPITAGVAALVWSRHPDWTPEQIAMQIRATGDRLKIRSTTFAPYFFKRVNAYRAVAINADLADGSAANIPGVEMISYTINGKQRDTIKSYEQVMKVTLTLKNYLAPTRAMKLAGLAGQALTTGGAISVPTIGTLQTVTTQEFDVRFDPSTGALYSEGNIPLVLRLTDGGYEELVTINIPISLPGWRKQFDATTATQTTLIGSSIDAVTTRVAWAATNNGNIPYYLRTISGAGWSNPTRITANQEPVYCITGWNDKIAWGGTGPTNGQAAVYKTTNGGGSWSVASVASITPFVNAIHFFDQNNGILVGDPLNGRWGIGVTTDGGVTWKPLENPLPVAAATEVGWNNSFTAYGDNVWFGTNNRRIYRSTDRGRTWSYGVTPATNSFGIAFASETEGLATFSVGANNGGYMIARTSDGGATWSEATPPFAGTQPQSVTFVPNTRRAFIGTQNGIYETKDFGANWKQMATPVINYQGMALSAQSDTSGAVGAFGINTVTQLMNYQEAPTSQTSDAGDESSARAIVGAVVLHQAVPNPVTSIAIIGFELGAAASVELGIHDELGRHVATLAEGAFGPGRHDVTFDASLLPSGAYYYTLSVDGRRITRRLTVLR